MCRKARSLSALFLSAVQTSKKSADAALKCYVSTIDPLSPSISLSEAITQRSLMSFKHKHFPTLPEDSRLPTFAEPAALDSEEFEEHNTRALSSILSEATSTSSSQSSEDLNYWKNVITIPWFSKMSNSDLSSLRKKISRERKGKWIFKSTQHNRFNKLVGNCAQKLGTGATIEVFGKLGRETGEKEYSALIGICIDKARTTSDVEVILEQISNVFFLTTTMKEQGFKLEDETYGPVLMFFIEMDMIKEFQCFSELLKNGNPTSVSRLGYYEMSLFVRTNDTIKVHDLCKDVLTKDGTDTTSLRENYMLALSENGWKEEFLMLLDTTDLKFSSVDYVANILKSFGRLSLETFAEKLLLECKTSEANVSDFILCYVINIPNLACEDVISKFKNLHIKLEMNPSSASYEKLIIFCCDFLEVHLALDLAKEMCEAGFMPSEDMLHPILDASGESENFNLVHQIYSIICKYDLKPNGETFRRMINLCARMKDFDGAYDMLKDLEKMNLTPTSGMYNAIMAGYYREKNIRGGLMVLKQMNLAHVKPDSQTFSLLLTNCNQEDDINKYYEEMVTSGVQVTKQILMALVNAYANCGLFEKAKQIILDKRIPANNLNEVKSVLVNSLASFGQVDDALSLYNEIKQAGCDLEPKAVMSLMGHLQTDVELSIMLQLLDELKDPRYWIDGCRRVILYCVLHKHLSSAIDLMRQLKNNFCEDEFGKERIYDEVFCLIAELDPTYLEVGLELLRVVKGEFGMSPPRKCLDFLLSACVDAKDLDKARLIWKEYKSADLPYNVLSFLRMYQALLACGDSKSAKILLGKIPKSDSHVRCIIQQSDLTKRDLNVTEESITGHPIIDQFEVSEAFPITSV